MNSSIGIPSDPSLEDDEIPKIGDNVPEITSKLERNIENLKLDTQSTHENMKEGKEKGASDPNENRHSEGWFHENNEAYLKIRKEAIGKWVYPSAILIMCIIAFSVAALLPTHDVIRYPEYWYEVTYV